MKVKTDWWGATFTPETEEDEKLLKEMETWEITETYEGGGWGREDNGDLYLSR